MKGLLIINADDLGMDPEINDGILFGLGKGYISDVSLMPKGPCAASAAHELLNLGKDHAGIHIDLDALLGWKTGGRELYTRTTLMKMFEDEEFIKTCALEARDQIERFLDLNLYPTHIDTHHHVHGFPVIFMMLLELTYEFNIAAMRFSRSGYHLPTRIDIPYDSKTFLHMENLLRKKDIIFPENYLENASNLFSVKEGITELVVHPSLSGDKWRVEELEFLVSDKGVKRLAQDDIRLVSYKEILTFQHEYQGNDSGKSG